MLVVFCTDAQPAFCCITVWLVARPDIWLHNQIGIIYGLLYHYYLVSLKSSEQTAEIWAILLRSLFQESLPQPKGLYVSFVDVEIMAARVLVVQWI